MDKELQTLKNCFVSARKFVSNLTEVKINSCRFVQWILENKVIKLQRQQKSSREKGSQLNQGGSREGTHLRL